MSSQTAGWGLLLTFPASASCAPALPRRAGTLPAPQETPVCTWLCCQPLFARCDQRGVSPLPTSMGPSLPARAIGSSLPGCSLLLQHPVCPDSTTGAGGTLSPAEDPARRGLAQPYSAGCQPDSGGWMARKQPSPSPGAPTTNNPSGASRCYFAAGVYSEQQILGVESIYIRSRLATFAAASLLRSQRAAAGAVAAHSAGCPSRAPSATATRWETTLSARLGARF